MLSARGAITTSVAMVECASGQNMANRDVFLLSELEKVWVTHAVLARRLLLDTRAAVVVQIPHFGSFWTESQLLHVDAHRQRYATRRLCFGLCRHFATRYGVDTSKVPLEPLHCHRPSTASGATPSSGGMRPADGQAVAPGRRAVGATPRTAAPALAPAPCRAIHTAEVVELCGVPAHTAQAALREFVLYVGEGLYRGRVFQLVVPGVATMVMKREKMMLTPDAELLRDFFALDARRWPAAVREACERAHTALMLQQPQQPQQQQSLSRPLSSSSSSVCCSSSTAASSAPWRPASSRVSWRSSSQTATLPGAADVPARPTFVTACASGRLFSDIAKEQEQRRHAAALAQQREAQAEQQQADEEAAGGMPCAVRRWHDAEQRDHDDKDGDDKDEEEAERLDGSTPCHTHAASHPLRSGESVYQLVADGDEDGDGAYRRRARPSASLRAPEPEVELFEEVDSNDGDDGDDTAVARAPVRSAGKHADSTVGQATAPPRPLGKKDAQLEAVLRREERFSRPISRQAFHEQCSAQELIYGVHTASSHAHAATSTRT